MTLPLTWRESVPHRHRTVQGCTVNSSGRTDGVLDAPGSSEWGIKAMIAIEKTLPTVKRMFHIT